MAEFSRKPLWYKDAIIYELHVKCFQDARGDGMGDFRGLIGRLDYLVNLGVTAIWLLPFYPSPLRDDGYDIADYADVHPSYGNLADFDEFLAQAHARGLYVITELVLNHTSDQHPWFQRARRAPPGSPERDFYVWSQDKEKYSDARIIFGDYESSNWAWDAAAQSWYWHRFFSHQPDLNFDNPQVHSALMEVVDFWLKRGVDGLRLDAVPYLYEREGTSCENLPETHAFLRSLATHVREHFDHRMLLAEANQWPEDAAAYFGDGESCQMAFHFPLMPRLYMAVEVEERFPIEDILASTPNIPESCQWAIFLRNHDELTLEMVTEEERDFMVRAYARDRRARINLGIRRRLAPLLANNRRKMELLNLLLLSLPGTPVLYYGDEIGMGDNFFLGDRDGVRTPMQWSPDRNAGFSRANAQQLFLPVIIDPEYHYETINVENQERNPSSLLWWMRRTIHLRKEHPAFSRGTLRFLNPENPRILVMLREWEGESILVLANLSRHPQTGQLDLSGFQGREPVELTGRTHFPRVQSSPYPIMMGSYEALWLLLQTAQKSSVPEYPLPDLGAFASWPDFLGSGGTRMERDVFPNLSDAPWFAGRDRLLREIRLQDSIDLGPSGIFSACLVIRAVFLDGEPEDYSLLVGFVDTAATDALPAGARLAALRIGGRDGCLCEGQHVPELQALVLEAVQRRAAFTVGTGPFTVESLAEFPVPAANAESPSILVLDSGGEEIRFAEPKAFVLRWFRRLREGQIPDLEILREISGQTGFSSVPKCLSIVHYQRNGEPPRILGYTQQWIQAHHHAGDLAAEQLNRYLEGVATSGLVDTNPDIPVPLRAAFQAFPDSDQSSLGESWPEFLGLLGERLAELHESLWRCGENPDFKPEAFTLQHQQAVYHSIQATLRRNLARLSRRIDRIPEILRSEVLAALSLEHGLLLQLKRLIHRPITVDRIRIHGDLALERVLFTGRDVCFTGFDGEPWRQPAERRFKLSALRDVAALQHSLCLTVETGLETYSGALSGSAKLIPWARRWADLSGGMLVDAYLHAAQDAPFLPRNPEDIHVLLDAFRLERAAHELNAPSPEHPARFLAALHSLHKFQHA